MKKQIGTWKELASLLLDQLQKPELRLDAPPQNPAEWVQKTTLQQNQKADQAVLFFLEHWAWPPLEPHTLCLLRLRLAFAAEQAERLSNRATNDPAEMALHARVLLVSDWYENAVSWSSFHFRGG
jgi:hypothetical protein